MKMVSRVKKHSLKFLSLFLAIFLWIYVLNSEKVRFEKTVSLEYILPEDMVFAVRPPSDAVFSIEGPRAFARTVSEREDRLILDLNRANPSRKLSFQVDINPAQISLPFGMRVESVLPKRLDIKLEMKASKIVPVKVQFFGELPDKLSLERSEVIPAEVEINGPRSLISNIKVLTTRPIDVHDLVGQETVSADINITDDRLNLPGGSKVVLSYKLKAASANLTLKEIPIKFLAENQTVVSKTKFVNLKLLVPEKIIKNRSNISSSVQVWADIPQNSKGRIEVPLRVIHPPSMMLLEISPKSIIVYIQ